MKIWLFLQIIKSLTSNRETIGTLHSTCCSASFGFNPIGRGTMCHVQTVSRKYPQERPQFNGAKSEFRDHLPDGGAVLNANVHFQKAIEDLVFQTKSKIHTLTSTSIKSKTLIRKKRA